MIEWIQDNKWHIVIPEGTMHKFLGDNKPYVVNLMYNSFNAFHNYIQTGRLGLFENLSVKDCEAVRRIAIGKRDIPLKINLA
jgi:hypothetical protein